MTEICIIVGDTVDLIKQQNRGLRFTVREKQIGVRKTRDAACGIPEILQFDFLSPLSSDLLASCTVGFRNVGGILLNFMIIFFKMVDRQIAKFCHFVNMADIEIINIFLDSCESWLSENIDFLKIAS